MGAEYVAIPAEQPLVVDYDHSGLRKYLNLPFGFRYVWSVGIRSCDS